MSKFRVDTQIPTLNVAWDYVVACEWAGERREGKNT